MASPSFAPINIDDYLQGQLDQLKSQFFGLSPELARFNPPQPTQQQYDDALQPVANAAMGVGLKAADIAGLPATAVVNALTGRGNADQLIGASPQTAGLNSLPLPILQKMIENQSARDLAGPTIDDVINARNELYHATGNLRGIQNSGNINPQFYSGVSTARSTLPITAAADKNIRIVLDPNKMPLSTPIAEPNYGKTVHLDIPTILNSASDDELQQMAQEAKEKGYTQEDFENPYINKAILMDTPTYKKVATKANAMMNQFYEYETRTKGQPIDLNKTAKGLLIKTWQPNEYSWGGKPSEPDPNVMNAITNNFESNNPLPFTIINRKNLPVARVIANKILSQQVTGQGQ